MRAAVAAVALAALALTGCETTAERSAKLERAAERLAGGQHAAPGVSAVTRPSSLVKVLRATLLRSSEGAAAVVAMRNSSARALGPMPIAIVARDAAGKTVFQNDAAGLERALVMVPSLAPHALLTWVDDQIPAGGAPATVSARVGEAQAGPKSVPSLSVAGLHQIEDPTNGVGTAGRVTNASSTGQLNLVVFVVAVRGGRTVAAGRAVLTEVAPHSTRTFSAFFIGDPRGATLRASAPATTLG